jgi:tRNA(Arg) A34 adenosine deaminase TadA
MDDASRVAEACRLAIAAVLRGDGGPFGAVIVMDGEVIGRGASAVLKTGDPTAHAEILAIRDASARMGREYMLEPAPDPAGQPEGVPARARMLLGAEIYASSAPCAMCLGAIYWARLSRIVYAAGYPDTVALGFDDGFQYEELARPVHARRVPAEQVNREAGLEACRAWSEKAGRIPY